MRLIVSDVSTNPSEQKMTDMLVKCDRFRCTISPQTRTGKAWMKHNVITVADSNIAVIDREFMADYEKTWDGIGITYRRV